jgi:hypothetical protein
MPSYMDFSFPEEIAFFNSEVVCAFKMGRSTDVYNVFEKCKVWELFEGI